MNIGSDIPEFPLSLPVGFTEGEFKHFIRTAMKLGGSETRIQSGDYIWGEIKRKITRLTDRKLEHNECERVLRFTYGQTGPTQLAGGTPLDFEYEIPLTDSNFDAVIRFRANATASRVGAIADGISLTMRSIPGLPLPWEKMKAPQDITDNFFPQYGLVLVVGTTGSGKSTLMSSGNRRRLENADRPVMILSYEDPIESVYTGLAGNRMPQPSQVQIERHLTSFNEAGRNAMRRKGDVIIMGESRDKESVSACFEMALSGHAVYSTVHADTPSECFARMVSFFPEDSQPAAANKLLSTLKMIVAQKLERRTDGEVEAVRSWLVIDREVKKRLGAEPFYQWGSIVDKMLDERGTSFERQTLPLVQSGALDFEAFRRLTNMTIREAEVYLTEHGAAHAIPVEIPVPLADSAARAESEEEVAS